MFAEPGLNSQAGPPVRHDLVDHRFSATALNLLGLTGISEHSTGEGELYLCASADVCSGRIVGYSIDPRVTASLRTATVRRNPVGTVVHSTAAA